jgi:hypothetical protein
MSFSRWSPIIRQSPGWALVADVRPTVDFGIRLADPFHEGIHTQFFREVLAEIVFSEQAIHWERPQVRYEAQLEAAALEHLQRTLGVEENSSARRLMVDHVLELFNLCAG